MTQPIHLIGSTYAVEVPDNAYGFEFDNPLQEGDLVYYLDYPSVYNFRWLSVPPGNWQIICTTKGATEEQAESIVQVISNGKISGRPQYRRYDRDPVKDTPARCWTRDPRHALETLVASKGLDPDKTLIIKKVS